MNDADRIRQLIDERRCTRQEWHALRRWEGRRRRGMSTLGISLRLALVVGQFVRAARKMRPVLARLDEQRRSGGTGRSRTLTTDSPQADLPH